MLSLKTYLQMVLRRGRNVKLSKRSTAVILLQNLPMKFVILLLNSIAFGSALPHWVGTSEEEDPQPIHGTPINSKDSGHHYCLTWDDARRSC